MGAERAQCHQWQTYIASGHTHCTGSDYKSTGRPYISSCLPFHYEAFVVYLLCTIMAFTRNKSLTCRLKLSKHLPGSQVRGLKIIATLEKHNPKRSICKIKDQGFEKALVSIRHISFTLWEKPSTPNPSRCKTFTKPSITLTEGLAALLYLYIFLLQSRTDSPTRNMPIKLWDKTFDSLRQIMKQNLLIKNAFV